MKNFRRDHDKEKTSERRAGAEGTSWSSGPPSKRARHCIEVTKLNRYRRPGLISACAYHS